MPQCMGISCYIASSLDADTLPEFECVPDVPKSFSHPSEKTATVYTTSVSGAQLWFEYTISEPHTSASAGYLFKLLFNNQIVTSWDCTAKHGYTGKTMCSLHNITTGQRGERMIVQRGFIFDVEDTKRAENYVEIRVFRIEKRRRIQEYDYETECPQDLQNLGVIRLADCGRAEAGRKIRRYRYQLIDAKDEPYVTFRFFPRTEDWLEQYSKTHGLVNSYSLSSLAELAVPEVRSSPARSTITSEPSMSSPARVQEVSKVVDRGSISSSDPSQRSVQKVRITSDSERILHHDTISQASLSTIARDSLEDVHQSSVRQPETILTAPDLYEQNLHAEKLPADEKFTAAPRRRSSILQLLRGHHKSNDQFEDIEVGSSPLPAPRLVDLETRKVTNYHWPCSSLPRSYNLIHGNSDRNSSKKNIQPTETTLPKRPSTTSVKDCFPLLPLSSVLHEPPPVKTLGGHDRVSSLKMRSDISSPSRPSAHEYQRVHGRRESGIEEKFHVRHSRHGLIDAANRVVTPTGFNQHTEPSQKFLRKQAARSLSPFTNTGSLRALSGTDEHKVRSSPSDTVVNLQFRPSPSKSRSITKQQSRSDRSNVVQNLSVAPTGRRENSLYDSEMSTAADTTFISDAFDQMSVGGGRIGSKSSFNKLGFSLHDTDREIVSTPMRKKISGMMGHLLKGKGSTVC